MAKLYVTDSDQQQHQLEIESGLSLMEHLRNADFDEVQAICGGCCSCATCHVHIINSPVGLPEVEESEEMLLEMADGYDQGKSRLSCQIELDDTFDGLRLELIDEGF